MSQLSHLDAAFEGALQCGIVGELEIGADGDAVSQAGHFHAEGLYEPRYIHAGGLALCVGVEGHYDLGDAAGGDAVHELGNFEVVRA